MLKANFGKALMTYCPRLPFLYLIGNEQHNVLAISRVHLECEVTSSTTAYVALRNLALVVRLARRLKSRANTAFKLPWSVLSNRCWYYAEV